MIHNWDAQPKNCKVFRTNGPGGPETWYVVSDLGAAFAGGPKQKFNLAGFRKEKSFIKKISADTVELRFADVVPAQARLHQRIPLAHAQWFRKQLLKLTEDDIQAAFDAAFATDGLNKAYASGTAATIKTARQRELSAETRSQISEFVGIFRSKIDELKEKVPEA